MCRGETASHPSQCFLYVHLTVSAGNRILGQVDPEDAARPHAPLVLPAPAGRPPASFSAREPDGPRRSLSCTRRRQKRARNEPRPPPLSPDTPDTPPPRHVFPRHPTRNARIWRIQRLGGGSGKGPPLVRITRCTGASAGRPKRASGSEA